MNTKCEPLIRNYEKLEPLNYVPCGIILGKTGAGKTTLFNILCGTSYTAKDSSNSVTQKLYLHSVNCGDHPFVLVDTPGTDSRSDAYKHAVLIRESLTAKRINTIFVIVRYDPRFCRFYDEYLEVSELVGKYKSKIVLMISVWDNCKTPGEASMEICQDVFKDISNNIIFYSSLSDPKLIARYMYHCLTKGIAENLDLPEDEFFIRINILDQARDLKEALKKYELKLKEMNKEYEVQLQKIITDTSLKTERDYILHSIIIAFREETEEVRNVFIQTHSSGMSDMNFHALCIKVHKMNIIQNDQFVAIVYQHMSYNPNDPNDPRNTIKRCPYCKLVWSKLEGCDGETTCGNRPFNYLDIQKTTTQFFKYSFKRINDKLTWTKNEIPQNPVLVENATSANSSLMYDTFNTQIRRLFRKINIIEETNNIIEETNNMIEETNNIISKNENAVGCGKTIIWKDCERLSDEELCELFKVQTIERVKDILNGANFVEIRKNFDFGIDKRFIGNDDGSFDSNNNQIECPICKNKFPQDKINDHVNYCLENLESEKLGVQVEDEY